MSRLRALTPTMLICGLIGGAVGGLTLSSSFEAGGHVGMAIGVLMGALLGRLVEVAGQLSFGTRLGALIQRELLAYFYAPVPYLVMFLFLAITWFFAQLFLQQPQARIDYAPIFQWLDFSLLIFMPLLTMNSVAEERSRNTLETLLTAPVSDWQVIFSKWFGTFAFYVVMLVPTLIYWVVFLVLGKDKQALDTGPVVTSYLGVLLLGALYIAIGIFASSLTENGPLSAFLAFCIMIGLMVGEVLLRDATWDWLRKAAEYVSQRGHFRQFLSGRIPVHDLVYFAMMTVLFLFLSVRALESRKWR